MEHFGPAGSRCAIPDRVWLMGPVGLVLIGPRDRVLSAGRLQYSIIWSRLPNYFHIVSTSTRPNRQNNPQ